MLTHCPAMGPETNFLVAASVINPKQSSLGEVKPTDKNIQAAKLYGN